MSLSSHDLCREGKARETSELLGSRKYDSSPYESWSLSDFTHECQKPHWQPLTVHGAHEIEAREREKESLGSFATSSLKTASAQRIVEGLVDRRKKHIQNYLLTNDAENVMNKYPFLDLLL